MSFSIFFSACQLEYQLVPCFWDNSTGWEQEQNITKCIFGHNHAIEIGYGGWKMSSSSPQAFFLHVCFSVKTGLAFYFYPPKYDKQYQTSTKTEFSIGTFVQSMLQSIKVIAHFYLTHPMKLLLNGLDHKLSQLQTVIALRVKEQKADNTYMICQLFRCVLASLRGCICPSVLQSVGPLVYWSIVL